MNPVPIWSAILTPPKPTSLRLDLQFAADQSYVSRRGPLPTFSRTTAGTFVGSNGLIQSAAIDVPRIDFDPATLACRGLLIEEGRTNVNLNSEDLSAATWFTTGLTITTNQTTAPDGTSNADLISEATPSTLHLLSGLTTAGTNYVIGTAYTASIFVKKGSGATAPDWIALRFTQGFPSTSGAAFNVSTGSIGLVSANVTAAIVNYGNGWWRISITATATVVAAITPAVIGFTNNNNSIGIGTYAGQTTSNLFAWGAQVEAGAFATSYIPTTTTSLIRSADLCSITGAAFTGFYNQTEGTLVFKGSKQAVQLAVTPTYVACDDVTFTNRILIYFGGVESSLVTVGGVAQASVTSGINVPALTPFGMAFRYKLNDFALSLSGGSVATDTSGTVPTNTQMTIGSRLGSSFMGGWIQSIQYYNTIKTNAQLQALSLP
jgi:hypothetical protein